MSDTTETPTTPAPATPAPASPAPAPSPAEFEILGRKLTEQNGRVATLSEQLAAVLRERDPPVSG